ncbi:MAG: sigma-54-dependent Fis family transcriptional regulator [bacterium]|nr:sigma-54-dependent Fis family transcriptional regulator [bacterium]
MGDPIETHVFLGMPAVIRSERMHRTLEVAGRVASVDAAVLICGESGAGKEVVARAVHQYSRRASQPWVDVSCAALPEHLIESELFGHEKGAYSSADSAKPGLFELADKGTLFLDEVGELEPRMQVKLLRILDGSPYYRLGGTKKINLDVRVIAATNRDLSELVSEGRFRVDLFHRLTQLCIDVPPLRERTADIVPLARYFLEQHQLGKDISADARTVLERYDWPGNVRELRNIMLRVGVLSSGPDICASDIPEEIRGGLHRMHIAVTQAAAAGPPSNGRVESPDMKLETMERRLIFKVLQKTGGHQQRAADMLGISRRTLSRKLRLYATEAEEHRLTAGTLQ